MPGLIIAGRLVPVPGVVVVNYLDDPRLRLTWRNCRTRPGPVNGIIGHSESGDDPHVVLEGNGPQDPDHGAHLADVDESDALAGKAHSQHISIGRDAIVYQFADLASEMTWHAPPANATTIGIELDDRPAATLPVTTPTTHVFYRQQLAAFVAVCDVITRALGIQRQVVWPYQGPIDALHGGVHGICGHRDQTGDRGPGDPGDAPMQALMAAGYESGTVQAMAARWAERQRSLAGRGAGIVDDGVPGPATCAAVKRFGAGVQTRTGLWVRGQATSTDPPQTPTDDPGMSDTPVTDPVPTPAPTPAPVPSPLWTHPSFWLTLLAWVAAMVTSSGAFPSTSPAVKIAAFIGAALATLGYHAAAKIPPAALIAVIGLGLAGTTLTSCTPIHQCLTDPNPSAGCLVAQQSVTCSNPLDPLAAADLFGDLKNGASTGTVEAQIANLTLEEAACVAAQLIADAEAGKLAPAPGAPMPVVLHAWFDDWKARHGLEHARFHVVSHGAASVL